MRRADSDGTQAHLVTATQVWLSTVKNFEAGRILPSLANLLAMQRALEAAEVEFLPGDAVRLRPDPITFGSDYLVDRYRFRLIAYLHDRELIGDVSREARDDHAKLVGASIPERRARFQNQRVEFEACAEDFLRSQAPSIDRVMIDTETFHERRQRCGELVAQAR